MARKKRGELGNAIRNMRLRKQAEMQNTQESALAPPPGTIDRMHAGPRGEQSQAEGHPHVTHRGTHARRSSK